VIEYITRTIETGGYPGIVLLMFLENVFPPLPSEIIVPFAGYAAAQGKLTLIGVVASGTLGSVAGTFHDARLAAVGLRADVPGRDARSALSARRSIPDAGHRRDHRGDRRHLHLARGPLLALMASARR
jgi:hypothetical protein